jgi:hypothetical protein
LLVTELAPIQTPPPAAIRSLTRYDALADT